MTDKKDDPGKGASGSGKPASASDPAAAKRPHAVIDLKATEVVVNKGAEPAKADATGLTAPGAAKDQKPTAPTGTSVPPTAVGAKAQESKTTDPKAAAASKPADLKSAGTPAANASASPAAAKRSGGLVSHLAAGVVGGALALFGGQAAGPMLGLDFGATPQPPPELVKRLAALEQAQSQRPAATSSADAQKLAAAESRLAKLEDAAATLRSGQTAVASDVKGMADKVAAISGTDNAGTRLTKLEGELKALVEAANNDPRNAGRLPQLAQLTAKIGEMETSLVTRTTTVRREIGQEMDQRFAQTAEQAESARSRLAARTQTLEQSLKSVADETGAVRTAVDALKTDVESKFKQAAKPADVQSALAPVATKLAAIEQNVQGVVKSEQDRNATAGNILLSLELSNLKRALDRGGKYASELAAVKKLAGGKLDLAVLEAQQNAGVPSAQTLVTELRSLAHAMLDAEAEPADASVTDRMLSGFKSIVRVRKTNFSPDDKGTEATIARMERALVESRLADVLDEAKKLPAKAAAPAADWLKRIDSRYQVDKALAALEASLKTSLAGGAAPAKGELEMIRLALFLVGVLAIAAGFHWLADRPGSLVLDWQGYVIETSVFRAVILFAILFGVVNVAWSLIRQLWRSPAAIGQIVTRRRERRGLDAISSGMIAIGSGDRALATRAAVQARKSLPNEPLTHLLRAQAAQLQGDSATSRRIFEAMLAAPDTEQLGLRGLFLEAQREGENIAATQFAERALKLNPKLEWPAASLFDLQCKAKHWSGALDTVASARRHGHIDKKVADRRRAVLLAAQAQAIEDSHGDKAAELALEAHGLAPDLVPAAAIAGRVLASRGQTPKAAKVLSRTWKSVQHPELAAIYAHARPGDSVSDRLERVRQLAKSTPQSSEGPIALATAAIEARDWELARSTLEPLLDRELSQRICTMMARIEGEGFSNTGKSREWLARALHAQRDPAWTADGVVAGQWAPTSPVTGALDAFEWRVPVEALEKPDSALITARMDELIKLGSGSEQNLTNAAKSVVSSRGDEPTTIEVVPPARSPDVRPAATAKKVDDEIEVVAEPVAQQRAQQPATTRPASATVTPLQPVATANATRKPLDASAFITPQQHAPDDPGPRSPPQDDADAKSKLERYRLIGAKTDGKFFCPVSREKVFRQEAAMSKVLYERDGRIARITLNRPEVLNAIDDDVPRALADAVARADSDPHVHAIVLAGAGRAFCAGYDLTAYASGDRENRYTQAMPWDPMKDYAFMSENTHHFMSLFRSRRPVICKVHGFAVAGGSDIALCSDLIVMADDALIGYPPVRVWGCPTTAMWVYRLGAEKAKRMLFTGDKISGKEAEALGLVLKSVPADRLDEEVDAIAHRIATVPQNQLAMQKLMVNQALYNMGLMGTQMIATVFDGITRHSPEGMNFKRRSEEQGWKQAVEERDQGTFDWTTFEPIKSNR